MGLFKPGTGSANGTFVGEDEKAVLIFNKVPFAINKVVLDTGGQYGAQYLIETVLPGSDDPRVIGFKAESVPNRAEGLQAIIDMQEAGTYEPITVCLVKDGRAVLIEEV